MRAGDRDARGAARAQTRSPRSASTVGSAATLPGMLPVQGVHVGGLLVRVLAGTGVRGMSDPRSAVAAIFAEWLGDRYPGTRWVVELGERTGNEPANTGPRNIPDRSGRDESDTPGQRLAV